MYYIVSFDIDERRKSSTSVCKVFWSQVDRKIDLMNGVRVIEMCIYFEFPQTFRHSIFSALKFSEPASMLPRFAKNLLLSELIKRFNVNGWLEMLY